MVLKNASLIILILGGVLLFIYIFFQTAPIFWDEAAYLANLPILHKYGLGKTFLEEYLGSAGPLHPVIHWLLEPLTNVEPPGVRYVNYVFLMGIIALCYYGFVFMGKDEASAKYSLMLLANPFIYVCTGMALTEIPAMFMMTLAVVLMLKARKLSPEKPIFWMYFITSAFSFSLAILGRQPFLLILPLVPLLSFDLLKGTKFIYANLIYILVASLLPSYVFYIWGGLLSADTSWSGVGLVPLHGVLAMGYCAVLTVFLGPKWFYINNRKFWIGFLAASSIFILLNQIYKWFHYDALRVIMKNVIGEELYVQFSYFSGALLIMLASLYIITSFIQLWKNRTNMVFVFSVLAILGLAASCVKINHQFSSRYVGQAAMFFIFALQEYDLSGWNKILRIVLGISLGLLMLSAYFW